jgi:hypothetical protein
VGAARVGEVRRWIRRLNSAEAAAYANGALAMEDADEVALGVAPLVTLIQDDLPAGGVVRLAS